MKKIYGYARISTPKQNIDRQVRNIQSVYSQAYIVREVYTGTKFQGRKELDKLLNKIRAGDTIVFDSVSRMSRNAEEGFLMYEELFRQSVNLIFLKEPHINTDTYKKALQGGIPLSLIHICLQWKHHLHQKKSLLGNKQFQLQICRQHPEESVLKMLLIQE